MFQPTVLEDVHTDFYICVSCHQQQLIQKICMDTYSGKIVYQHMKAHMQHLNFLFCKNDIKIIFVAWLEIRDAFSGRGGNFGGTFVGLHD